MGRNPYNRMYEQRCIQLMRDLILFCFVFFSLQLINLPQKLGIRNQNTVINHRHVFFFFFLRG